MSTIDFTDSKRSITRYMLENWPRPGIVALSPGSMLKVLDMYEAALAERADLQKLHDIEVGRRQRADEHRDEVQRDLAAIQGYVDDAKRAAEAAGRYTGQPLADFIAELRAALDEAKRTSELHLASAEQALKERDAARKEASLADDLHALASQQRDACGELAEKLKAALRRVDEIACRSAAANHPEDVPEPANRDGEELHFIVMEALK